MNTTLRPLDVILVHPDALSKITLRCELDKKLITSLEWGFVLHPDEYKNTRYSDIAEGSVIDWGVPEGYDDVVQYMSEMTVPYSLPIAGPAENIISLRRLVNAQPENIRNGVAWTTGTACHLKNMLQ
ncbi:TPA: hypothetical protein ACIWNT_000105 [Salmonella enterica subsp. enterica serovar Enteritidis]|jgi:hypothetical protein|nr:hypothetical protein [Salmonella enterica subsp. enterica serovar Weltevreden]ECN9196569.1 hypothetical protein [Salmonella enterica subsp. enterica serovar Enteritidis]